MRRLNEKGMKQMAKSGVLAALAGAAIALSTGGAQAASQMLALISTDRPVQLTCERGECSAELTAICLQPDRASPPPGKRYTQIGGEQVALIGETADGRQVALSAAEHGEFTALRGHNAVKFAIDGRVLSELGVRRVSVQVGEMVSLLPEPVMDDPLPQTEADIALATGPMRTLAARLVDNSGDRIAAAQIARDLVNYLPKLGRSTPAQRAAAWSAVIKTEGAARTQAAFAMVETALEQCDQLNQTSGIRLRSCLGSKHDSFVGELNNGYWDAIKAGS